MLKSIVVALLLAVVTIPSNAYATSNFIEHDQKIIFQTKNNVYRHRAAEKPLQLSSFNADEITSSVTAVNKIWLTATDENGRQQLYRSVNGLSYEPVDNMAGGRLALAKLGNRLVVSKYNQGGYSITLISDGQNQTSYLNLPLLSLPRPESFKETESGIYVFTANDNGVAVLLISEGGWQNLAPLGCPLGEVRLRSLPVARCSNGDLWLWLNHGWVNIAADVSRFAESSSLVAAQTAPHTLAIWFDETTTFFDLAPLTINEFFVFGQRIVIGDGTATYELIWQLEEPELVLIENSRLQRLILVENQTEQAFMQTAARAWLATEIGWQSLTSQGNFNQARLTSQGYLVWQTNEAKTQGGLTQFLALGSSELVKVNPWSSTTSPVQAVYTGDNLAFVGVITNSGTGNVNLYRSSNYRQWNRLTLPTKPTLAVAVAEARKLPATTLVEVAGVMSVNPGLVGNEIAYLEDETGGIQIFLHSSKGVLPSKRFSPIKVTGEVSSSQAKRLVLADVTDLEVMSGQMPFTAAEFNAQAALGLLGRSIILKDRLAKIEKDYAFFGAGDSLKVHFKTVSQNLKEIFLPEDLVSAAAVIDWNSASGKVEGWYLGEPTYLILDRPKLTQSSESSQGINKTAKSTISTSGTIKTKIPLPTTPTTSAKRVTRISPAKTANDNETVVAASHSGALSDLGPLHLVVLVMATLLAGLLVASGKLTRALLDRIA